MSNGPTVREDIASLSVRHESSEGLRPALRRGATEWSYARLKSLVDGLAARLRREGVVDGDRVLLLLGNSPEYVVSFLAAAAAGAVAVPADLNGGAERLRSIIEETSPSLCVSRSDAALPENCAIRRLPLEIGAPRSAIEEPVGAERRAALRASSPAAILYSSGTTGRPKGAVLHHSHLAHIARILAAAARMDKAHRELVLSPLTHSGGLQRVTATLLAGGCVVFPEGTPSIQGLLEDLRRHEIRGFFAPPPLLRALLAASADKVRRAAASLASIESASAPLAPDELRALLGLLPGCRILFQYGLTECSRAFILDARGRPDKLHTVGTATPGLEARIEAGRGEPARAGETGEIWLRGPQRCGGYWGQPGLPPPNLEQGWLRTGDFGSLDDEGFLLLRGRRDDKINCGGFSYFPAEAERELGNLEGVRECMIAGVPDPAGMLHQVPWAFVVPRAPKAWSPRSFIAEAKRRLPPHMVPRNVVVVPAIPLSAGAKPDRRKALELYGPGAARPETREDGAARPAEL